MSLRAEGGPEGRARGVVCMAGETYADVTLGPGQAESPKALGWHVDLGRRRRSLSSVLPAEWLETGEPSTEQTPVSAGGTAGRRGTRAPWRQGAASKGPVGRDRTSYSDPAVLRGPPTWGVHRDEWGARVLPPAAGQGGAPLLLSLGITLAPGRPSMTGFLAGCPQSVPPQSSRLGYPR